MTGGKGRKGFVLFNAESKSEFRGKEENAQAATAGVDRRRQKVVSTEKEKNRTMKNGATKVRMLRLLQR